MASTKVTLRTAFNDTFRTGDIVITREGTELPSRKQADEVIETARRNGVTLYEVESPSAADEKKTEGSGS